MEGGWEERGVAHGNLSDLVFMFVKQSQEKKFLDSQSAWNLFLRLLHEIYVFQVSLVIVNKEGKYFSPLNI